MKNLFKSPLTAAQVKARALDLGADLVGIADGAVMDANPPDPADPRRPSDITEHDGARVIVLARRLSDGVARIANTSCLAMPGLGNETQVMALDLAGVAVSAGAACSSGKVGASHVLSAMGVDDAVARSAIRVSLGWTSTAADVGRFVEAWSLLYERTAAARNAA